MYITKSLCCISETKHNMVNQLYSNIKSKMKKNLDYSLYNNQLDCNCNMSR